MTPRYDITTIQVKAIADMLRDEEDDILLADMLESETDLHPMLEKLLWWIEQDEGNAAALKAQIDDRTERKRRFEARIAAKRDAVTALLDCAGLDKITLPEATLSVRQLPAKLAVTDPAAVPEEFTVSVPRPNLDAIKAHFNPADPVLPNWLRLDPPKPSLTIRRK
jgi:hypothetical protein